MSEFFTGNYSQIGKVCRARINYSPTLGHRPIHPTLLVAVVFLFEGKELKLNYGHRCKNSRTLILWPILIAYRPWDNYARLRAWPPILLSAKR